MKISVNVLRQYVQIDQDVEALSLLLEDIGIEVKRRESVDDDEILTLELLANRGDHHSYVGISRELYGKTGQALADLDLVGFSSSPIDIDVKIETDLCLGYSVALFERDYGANQDGFPRHCLDMIRLAESDTALAPVNATNIVGLEIGQPTHAFDADRIVGPVCVRESREGEEALPLFAKSPITLPVGTLVIADNEKILAIAGVIGCQGSETSVETTSIMLESAIFDPVSVRKTSKYLGISSHSSMVFERGASPDAMLKGAQRVGYLLSLCGWRTASEWKSVKVCSITNPQISLDFSELSRFFAYGFIEAEVRTSLTRLGFGIITNASHWKITVPSHRVWDVGAVMDIYEEVARMVGYNNLPSNRPPVGLPRLLDERIRSKSFIDTLLTNEGFFEVFTDGFYSESHVSKLCLKESSPHRDHIQTSNSCDRAFQFLKNNNVAHALDVIKTNANYKKFDVKAYEWTRIFVRASDAANGLCNEEKMLWGICSGEFRPTTWSDKTSSVSVYDLKGLLAKLSRMMGITLSCVKAEQHETYRVLELLHPNRRLVVRHLGQSVGAIGEIHPEVLAAWGIKRLRPCYFELTQTLLDVPREYPDYAPPSIYENVNRDICFVIPKPLESHLVSEVIASSSSWIVSVVPTDVFNSEQTGLQNAVTFSIELSPEKAGKSALLAEEINHMMDDVVSKVNEAFGSEGVLQR